MAATAMLEGVFLFVGVSSRVNIAGGTSWGSVDEEGVDCLRFFGKATKTYQKNCITL